MASSFAFYLLEPEVAGGWGAHIEVHPAALDRSGHTGFRLAAVEISPFLRGFSIKDCEIRPWNG